MPVHRTHRLARERSDGQSVDHRGPRLVTAAGHGDQGNRRPRITGEPRRDDERRGDAVSTTGPLARRVQRPSAGDQRGRQIASRQTADVRCNVNRRQIGNDCYAAHAVLRGQELRQPEQVEPPDRIGQRTWSACRPRSAKPKQRPSGTLTSVVRPPSDRMALAPARRDACGPRGRRRSTTRTASQRNRRPGRR